MLHNIDIKQNVEKFTKMANFFVQNFHTYTFFNENKLAIYAFSYQIMFMDL